jgi:glycosyltransferase involved in cell wall biosynthesis
VSGGLALGGATTFLCNFAGELVRRQIPAQVWSFEKENAHASDFVPLNIPVFCQDQRKGIYEDRVLQILEKLKQFNPSIVLSTLSPISFEVLRYMPPGVFRVGVGQSDDPNIYEMMRHYAPYMDLLAVVSSEMKRKSAALPEFSSIPIAWLPYGVPVPEDQSIPARDLNRPLRILYLGRLIREQKRVHLFPTIFGQLQASGIPFHWTIAGEGPEREFLERTMQSAHSQQAVTFCRQVPYAEVPKFLLGHDVFLLASDYEGLPLSLLEAMGCGLVPVVGDLPSGVRDVVDDTTGKRVNVDNIAGYAEAIEWLHHNREEMHRLSHNARERVRGEFSVSAMTDRWLKVLPKDPPLLQTVWPSHWKIQSILTDPYTFRFSAPGRVLRRLVRRFRS